MKYSHSGIRGRDLARLFLALLLAVLMCLPMVPAGVLAAGEDAGSSESAVWSGGDDTDIRDSHFLMGMFRARSAGSVELGGQSYGVRDFAPMADFITGASLVSGGITYDLLSPDVDTGTIGLYRGFSVSLSLLFRADDTAVHGNLYSWKMPCVQVADPLSGEIGSAEGEVYGHYRVDADGSVYVALNETGLEQSVLTWNLKFGAAWDTASDGKVVVDLGNGHILDMGLDIRRADVEKRGTITDPGTWKFKISVAALDDVLVSSIDDTVTVPSYDEIAGWLALEGIPVEDACYMRDVVLTYRDGDGTEQRIDIDGNRILIERVLDDPEGNPRIRYHIGFDTPVALPMDTEAELTYVFQLDPEWVMYLDLADAHYRFDNTAEVYLDDGSCYGADYLVRGSQRDMISKSYTVDGNTAEWRLKVYAGRVYALDGMEITDTLVDELEYLVDDPFVCSCGDAVLTPDFYSCGSREEFESMTAETARGRICLWDNSFKYFIPYGMGTERDPFYIDYKTTFDEEALLIHGSGWRLNEAELRYFGEHDGHGDNIAAQEFLQYNDGIHIDGEGYLYTNWSYAVSVPAGMPCEWFFFEDYVPKNKTDPVIYDTLRLGGALSEDVPHLSLYSLQEVRDLGIGLSVVTAGGEDITEDVFGRFYITDVGPVRQGDDYYFAAGVGDKNHAKRHTGGFDAMDEAYTVTVTIPMYLNGDAGSFMTHNNKVNWYYTADQKNCLKSSSSLNLYYINNDERLGGTVVASRPSDDGTKTVLTYQVWYDMYDKISSNGWKSGTGYVFGSTLTDLKYASYVPGSLKAYWTETIRGEERWTYDNPDSPYDGESDLLAIQEDVPHREGETCRLAEIVSESEAGFRVSIPYNKRTPGFYWKDSGGQGRFYSPLFEYEVEVDTAAMHADKDYRYRVPSEFRAFLTDGALDALTENGYYVDTRSLRKDLVQVPSRDNGYVAMYRIVVDGTSEEIGVLDSIDVIDEMRSSSMTFLPDRITVETGPDGLSWSDHDASKYRLMYDADANRLVCQIDGSGAAYYRITYAVKFTGRPGDAIDVSNTAYISGMKNQQADVSDSFRIDAAESFAEGSMAEIRVLKYNADNLSLKLPGAGFSLYRVESGIESGLSAQDTREDILDRIGGRWTRIADGTTDADGCITWRHNTGGVKLPMNTLLKLEETNAPQGYGKLEEPVYFYLSETNEMPDSYLARFDYEPYQTILYVANERSSLVLEKRDGATGEPLTGAKFSVYADSSCGEVLMRAVDNGDGTYYLGDLAMGGDYYLKETQAPEGYVLDDTAYTVRISGTGIVSVSPGVPLENGRYVITNRKDSVVLPDTGGPGSYRLYMGGAALVAAACFLAGKRRRGAAGKRMLMLCGLAAVLLLALPATAVLGHEVSGGCPKLAFDMPESAAIGDVVTVSAASENADSISWRLLRNGRAVDAGFTDAGGSFVIDADGTYVLIGIARSGSRSAMCIRETRAGSPRAGTGGTGGNRRALYSWSDSYVDPQNEQTVRSAMDGLACGTIYQAFSGERDAGSILSYLDRRAACGHRVYYLCGAPDWATEPDAASMLRHLERVIECNRLAEESGGAKFYGIQYDVEKLSSKEAMDQAVENYKAVYAVAREHDIKVEACLPYSLDSWYGFKNQLEDLIANGCDSIAVMNYNSDEIEQIRYEAWLCGEYGKGIVNITEMQPVGSHGLTADQTYHDDGIEAVEDMWREMQSALGDEVGFAYHYLDPILPLL